MSVDAGAGGRLRIVRGDASPEEVAALVAVLTARAQAHAEAAARAGAAARHRSAWSDRARLVRGPLAHGSGAWRASAWRI